MNSVWKLIDDLNKKKGISEIIINKPDLVYIERSGELIRLNIDLDKKDIFEFCQDIAKKNNKKFDHEHPIIDDVISDKSRINMIHESYTGDFPAITIRKYIQEITSLDALNGKFLITDKWIQFLKILVKSKSNIIVSGGTSSGKTTLLNLLLQEIHPTERVVTIEDTRELNFNIPNHISLITAPHYTEIKNPLNARTLVRNTLRMRPDRVIVGEVRGEEAFDLLQAMNTGHDGSMCSVHANSPVEALKRIENLYMQAGFNTPFKTVREQINSAVHYMIHLGRNKENERCITHISELSGMEGDNILTQEIGRLGQFGLEFTGLVPSKAKKLFDSGLAKDFFQDLN